jgi:hypothetical protein
MDPIPAFAIQDTLEMAQVVPVSLSILCVSSDAIARVPCFAFACV